MFLYELVWPARHINIDNDELYSDWNVWPLRE